MPRVDMGKPRELTAACKRISRENYGPEAAESMRSDRRVTVNRDNGASFYSLVA